MLNQLAFGAWALGSSLASTAQLSAITFAPAALCTIRNKLPLLAQSDPSNDKQPVYQQLPWRPRSGSGTAHGSQTHPSPPHGTAGSHTLGDHCGNEVWRSSRPWYLPTTSAQTRLNPCATPTKLYLEAPTGRRHYRRHRTELQDEECNAVGDNDELGACISSNLHPIHSYARHRGDWKQAVFEDYISQRTSEHLHSSSWLRLLPGPISMLTDNAPTKLKIAAGDLVRPLLSSISRQTSRNMQSALQADVERSFDMSEFQQGCSAAVAAVLRSYGAGDWAALREMVSEEMLEAMRQQHDELAEEGKFEVLQLRPDVQQVAPLSFGFWDADHISAFDSRWASSSSSSSSHSSSSSSSHSSSSWQVALVHVQAAVVHKLLYRGRYELGSNVVEVAALRAGQWVLARGPLPAGAVCDLQCPWQVVAAW